MPTDSTRNFRVRRLTPARRCAPRSFRTKSLKAGRKIVICCPRGKYSRKTGRCRVGTIGQAVLTPKRK